DTETFLEKHVDDRGQTVRGATGVRDNIVLGRIVLLVVDAHDDGDVFALGGRRDDDLARSGFQMAPSLGRLGEQAGRFNDVFHAKLFPGQGGRPFLDGEALDLVIVDKEGPAALPWKQL